MNIKLDDLKRRLWYEDFSGNIVEKKDPSACICRSCVPLQFHQDVWEYRYHPTNPVIKALCRNKMFYSIISKGKQKTHRRLGSIRTAYDAEWSQKCIVAMVNSSDYTLEEAVYIFATACERCRNVLVNLYIGDAGYEEHSEEWNNSTCRCKFCEEE